jgi:polar amino acid transport system substrate-binding protein
VTAADLAGIVMGAQVSTTFSNFAEETFTDTEVRLYPTAEEYQAELASGRIDAAIDDVVVLSEWLATEEGSCCKILGTLAPPEEIFGPGIGVGVRQGEEELRDAFSAAILAIRENGVYEEINNKYFNFDVYGE